MTKRITGLAAALCALAGMSAAAAQEASLDDLAFLEGHWRGGREGLVFEEIWSAAEGGVMTGMARGVSTGEDSALRVLEYIVISEEADGVAYRFKHFGADYSTWEENGPIVMALTELGENDITFSADPPSESVKSIRYWMPDADTLQADIVLVQDGEEGGFSLTFERAEK
ncbi:DUF6265 family protein [Hyphococcus luteus]|uniref:DUF6265 domain-containing protein n=1 Tax=Hyphococcus luteus TaxID=2058213 RepID=A0A2S7K7I0_9PROT|nr:DUF6265 family protein [Marinicaulis flavus]PQA88455.1 hypothetical protein CW354_09200 [Marinicaulis flavus]